MKTMLRLYLLLLVCFPQLINAQCPVVDLGQDTLICTGASITLDATNMGAAYVWSDGSTTPQLTTFFEGEYWVEVTLNGCTRRDTIYIETGAVIQASFTFEQQTVCSPLLVAFTSDVKTCSGSIASRTWDFGDGNTSGEINPVHAYAAPGNYQVSLSVTSSGGASYTEQQMITITGNIGPSLDLGDDLAVCQGDQITLDAGNPGSTYAWSNGSTSSSIDVFMSGKYHVAVSRNGCTVKDTITVTVTPLLWNDFAFVKVADCSPVSYRFTNKSRTCNRTISAWRWDFGDGTTSNVQHPQHDYYQSGQYTVRLTVTDNFGNTTQRSKKVNVAVTAFDVNLGSDTTICIGDALALAVSEPGAAFLWNDGSSLSSLLVNTAGKYSVEVTKNGCTQRDTIQIHTANSITAGFSYQMGTACLPVYVQFRDSSRAYCNQEITSWRWEFGDGTTSTQQHPVHAFQTSDSFSVKLTTTVSNGATASKTMKLGISNTPLSVDLPNRLVVCREDSFSLDAGISDAVYSWTPSSLMSSASSASPRVKPSRSQWYFVNVSKCSQTATDSIYVVVDEPATPVIDRDENLLTVKTGIAYEWYIDNRQVDGAASNNIRVRRAGYYSVKVYNENGCAAMSDQTFIIPAPNKKDNVEDIVVRCSPNPTPGPFNIILSKLPVDPVKLVIYDRYGRSLVTVFIKDHITHISLPRITRGMYFAETTINKRKRVFPVVVQ